MNFETNTNIISNKNISKLYYSLNLKHLIRFPYFKKELISPSTSLEKNIRSAYLINNRIMEKLTVIYNLKKLLEILFEQKLLDGITYKNCDENYNKMNLFLNKNHIEYINNIQKFEQPRGIKFVGN